MFNMGQLIEFKDMKPGCEVMHFTDGSIVLAKLVRHSDFGLDDILRAHDIVRFEEDKKIIIKTKFGSKMVRITEYHTSFTGEDDYFPVSFVRARIHLSEPHWTIMGAALRRYDQKDELWGLFPEEFDLSLYRPDEIEGRLFNHCSNNMARWLRPINEARGQEFTRFPTRTGQLVRKCEALLNREKYNGARTVCLQAIEASPLFVYPHVLLGKTYMAKGRRKEAYDCLTNAWHRCKDPMERQELFLERMKVLYELSDFDTAEPELSSVVDSLSLQPAHIDCAKEALYLLGMIHAKTLREDSAADLLARALQIDPEYKPALEALHLISPDIKL